MDDCVTYTKPEVVDYGSLSELTADVDHLNLAVGMVKSVVGASVLSAPLVPGDQGGTLNSQGAPSASTTTPLDGSGVVPGTDTVDAGDTLGRDGQGGPGAAGGGDPGGAGGAAGGGGGGDGRLPFTGLSVILVAGVGAGLAGAGASARARFRRDGRRPSV